MPCRPTILPATSLAIAGLLAACTPPGRSIAWEGTTGAIGDTTIITTTRGSLHGTRALDSVQVIWRSDSLDRPSQVLVSGPGTLAVADRERIFVLGTDGTVRSVLGRRGEGPGEFQRVGVIGGWGDTLAGLDRQNRHFSLFRPDGTLLHSGVIRLVDGLTNLIPSRLGVTANGLMAAWGTFVATDGTPGVGGVVRSGWRGDTAVVLRRITGQPYVFSATGGAARAVMFGPNPMVAIGVDGRYAIADGVEYCIDTGQGDGTAPVRICRAWDRVRVSPSIRTPDYAAIMRESGATEESLAGIREILTLISIPDRRNAIDWLFWDSVGRLWVRVVDSREAEVHPFLSRYTPARLPRDARWDVFAVDGRLAWELTLPRAFTPFDATAERAFGLLDTPEGDLAVAAVALPVASP